MDSKSRRISKLHDRFKSNDDCTDVFLSLIITVLFLNKKNIYIWNQSTMDNRGVSRGRSVTCDT